MEPPTDLHECLAILTLRTLGSSQEETASIVHRHKSLVSMVEDWFSKELTYPEAVKVSEDMAIKSTVHILLVPSEQIKPETLVKAAQLTADDILRHYRKDYVKERVKKVRGRPMELHLAQLANIAEILAHQVNRLVRYKDDDDIEAMGDVLGHLSFWRKSNRAKVTEGTDPIEQFRYENQHPVDPHLAQWLYIHYEHRFGKPLFKEWNQLSTGNVSSEMVDNLKLLAHGGLKPCPNCPICEEIMD